MSEEKNLIVKYLHNSQIAIAKYIYNEINSKLNLDNFNSIEIVVLTPSRTTLASQTSKNLHLLDKYLQTLNPSNKTPTQVFMATKCVDVLARLEQKIRLYPNTLFLIVHDECHWGRKQGSMLDKLYIGLHQLFEKMKSVNNLFFLQVSATAELFTEIEKKMWTTVNWMQVFKKEEKWKNLLNGYVSISDLDIREFDMKGDDAHSILIGEYAKALEDIGNNHPSDKFSFEFLKRCLNKQELLVIRLKKKEHVNILYSHFKIAKTRYQAILERLTVIKEIENCSERIGPFHGKTYESMDGQPIVLILCNKGDMGDVFPQTFQYDLRARYPFDKIGYFAAFKQSIGRACGFNKKAIVYVGNGVKDICKRFSVPEKLHSLVNLDFEPTKFHPVQHKNPDNFFTTFKDRIIILEAEPQMGKTGAVISVILELAQRIYLENPGRLVTEDDKIKFLLSDKCIYQEIIRVDEEIELLNISNYPQVLANILANSSHIKSQHCSPKDIVNFKSTSLFDVIVVDFLSMKQILEISSIVHGLLKKKGEWRIVTQLVDHHLLKEKLRYEELGFDHVGEVEKTGDFLTMHFQPRKKRSDHSIKKESLMDDFIKKEEISLDYDNGFSFVEKKGFKVVKDVGDGSCLFHSLASGVNYEKDGLAFRIFLLTEFYSSLLLMPNTEQILGAPIDSNLVDFVKQILPSEYAAVFESIHYNFPNFSLNQYMEMMSAPHCYGTNTEILMFLCIFTNVDVVLVTERGQHNFADRRVGNVIFLSHNGFMDDRAHFQHIVPKENIDNSNHMSDE